MFAKSNINNIIEALHSIREDTNYPDTSKVASRVYFPDEGEGIEFCKDTKISVDLLQYDSNGGYYYIEKQVIPHTVPKSKYGRLPVGTRYEKATYMNRFSEAQRNLFDAAGAVVYSKGCYYVDFDMVTTYKKRNHIK